MSDVLSCRTMAGEKPGPDPMDPQKRRGSSLCVYLTSEVKAEVLKRGGSKFIVSLIEKELESGTKLADIETANLQVAGYAVESTNQ